MTRVIYKEINDCTDCLYNRHKVCCELTRPINEISFKDDCPLPTRETVESFTRYITPKKSIRACGNCSYWERWSFNKNLQTELGICNNAEILQFCYCNRKACKEFKEV